MRAVAVVLIALGVACSRSHVAPRNGDTAEGTQNQPGGGAGGGNHAGDNAGASGGASPVLQDAAIEPGAQDTGVDDPEPMNDRSPRELRTTEIWTGELWSIGPLLCDPSAPWATTPVSIDPMGYVEPVVLVLEPGSDPSMPSGEIAFGRGDLPEEPGPAATANGDSGSFWLCSLQIPSKGGVYTVLDARRESDRLTFDVVPSEIWSTDCITKSTDCAVPCSPGRTCELQGMRDRLDLVIRGDTIEGTLGGAAFGTPSELRLKRIP
jgi:hypothetical protein